MKTTTREYLIVLSWIALIPVCICAHYLFKTYVPVSGDYTIPVFFGTFAISTAYVHAIFCRSEAPVQNRNIPD